MIKNSIKGFFRVFGLEVSRIPDDSAKAAYRYAHDIAPDDVDGVDRETRKILNLLDYTKTNKVAYRGRGFESGYHTIELSGRAYSGQRNPKERFADVPYEFKGANVLDIGSNQGGMLFAIADEINRGIGIDYDPLMVNVANRIRDHKGLDNFEFFVFDIDGENHDLIDNFLPDEEIDIVFLLAVCRWVDNWRGIIKKSREIADTMLFEANGSVEQQKEQVDLLKELYGEVTSIREASIDDPKNKSRELFICRA